MQRAQRYHPSLFSGDAVRAAAMHQLHTRQREEDSIDDEYSGLMTQREKDWVVKIQLLQLHTDNPYVDDYYHTVC